MFWRSRWSGRQALLPAAHCRCQRPSGPPARPLRTNSATSPSNPRRIVDAATPHRNRRTCVRACMCVHACAHECVHSRHVVERAYMNLPRMHAVCPCMRTHACRDELRWRLGPRVGEGGTSVVEGKWHGMTRRKDQEDSPVHGWLLEPSRQTGLEHIPDNPSHRSNTNLPLYDSTMPVCCQNHTYHAFLKAILATSLLRRSPQ